MWVHLIVSFFELAITGGIGFYIDYYLQKNDLALIVWFLGIILVIHRLMNIYESSKNNKDLLEEQNKSNKKTVDELISIRRLNSIVDLDMKSNIYEIDNIRKLFLSIREVEFQEIKNKILLDASLRLDKLAHSKETEELSSSDYYDWIFNQFDSTGNGDTIKAVSVMDNLEWDENDPSEVKFFDSNIKATNRGVKLERIFCMSQDLLDDALENKFIKAQRRDSKYKIKGYFADKDFLNRTDKSLLNAIDCGFIIVNNKVVLIDVFSSDGIARGRVVMKETIVQDYINIFDRLKRCSSVLI